MNSFTAILEHFMGDHAVSGVELIYTSHPSWPLLPEALKTGRSHVEPSLALSVLDSSFNPPTIAHLALARLSPPVLSNEGTSSTRFFDAKLLLFSIKNADKALRPRDATPSQRLQMMVLLARELQRLGEQSEDYGSQNVAVAVCQEPTFVGKSAVLKCFLRERMAALSSLANIRLTFLLGFDTLERLFAPRYYGSEITMKDALRRFLSSSEDNSQIICARRASGASYSQEDTNVLDVAAEFIESGSVVLVDIGEAERSLSSSEVRGTIRNDSDTWERKVPVSVAAYIKEAHLYAQVEGPH